MIKLIFLGFLICQQKHHGQPHFPLKHIKYKVIQQNIILFIESVNEGVINAAVNCSHMRPSI